LLVFSSNQAATHCHPITGPFPDRRRAPERCAAIEAPSRRHFLPPHHRWHASVRSRFAPYARRVALSLLVLKSLVLGHLVAQAATSCRVTVRSQCGHAELAAGPSQWASLGPLLFLIFYFQNFVSELNSKKICPKLQKSIENGIKLRKYEINFIVFLFSRPIHWA
jgi:hypothetical protein